MRVLQYFATTMTVLGILIFLQVIANSNHIASVSNFLRAWSLNRAGLEPAYSYPILLETYERISIYHRMINEGHLEDGMLVNRRADGSAQGKCDSLLFSAIRYASLKKLGMVTTADLAWQDIEKSQYAGHWYRHPKCRNHHTSRDMIIGLLIALSQKPEHYRVHLRSFLNYVGENKGFFSGGSPSVSYLSPAVAEVVRNMARSERMDYHTLPDTVRSAYSTVELDAMLAQAGYRSHLMALLVWLEFELESKFPNISFRTAVNNLALITRPFTNQPLQNQRLEYITQKLFDVDPQNLFFRYLRFRAAKAMTNEVRTELLSELLAMREFPRNHLPQNCHRRADYLWQRGSNTYKRKTSHCTITYSGVDFLWMSSLLLEDFGEIKPQLLSH